MRILHDDTAFEKTTNCLFFRDLPTTKRIFIQNIYDILLARLLSAVKMIVFF